MTQVKEFFPFSSRGFMISGLTFKPLIHFELVFMSGVRQELFHLFTCECPVFLAPFN